VALVALPVSAVLWVVAPEFIPALLGPQWTAVVLPFRLFTIGLFFRMSSKISDACTKAAGAVYSRALVQGIFALMVVAGALAGQRWGVGGVAVAVSIAMGINWLLMAALGRSVTGVSWSRFARAQVPGGVFALVVGAPVALAVAAARSAHLGNIPVLLTAGFTAAAVVLVVSRLRSKALLGPHGMWAFRRADDVFRAGFGRLGRMRASTDRLAKAFDADR